MILRCFCEGRRSAPHPRTEEVEDPVQIRWVCPVEGCGGSITHERALRAVPRPYQGVLADFADIGAIDVIDVGLFDLQVEYPRRDQVT